MGDSSFKAHVLDQLRLVPDVRAKAMFGGHGLYAGEAFFGILAWGRLFFRTDETNRAEYKARGMEPFVYEKDGRAMTMRYWEVPPDVLEDPHELAAWARRAIATQSATKVSAPRKRTAQARPRSSRSSSSRPR
jgi:DNA transformation protein